MPTHLHAAVVDLDGGLFEAQTDAGERFTLDADPPAGTGAAAGPKEAVLAALAGCTAMDVISLLRKKRQRVERYELDVTAESAAEHPRVFTRIVVEHRVTGAVENEPLRRSIELSATRYCPVNAMLSGRVTIEHRYRLARPGEPEETATVAVVGPEGAPA